MEIRFFTMELNNVVELKLAYRDLIKKNHPDVGGQEEDMKQINAEYEHLFKNVHELGRSRMTEEEKAEKDFHDVNDNFRDIVEKFIFLDGVIIDLVKSWVWFGGETFPHLATFQENQCKFSKSKKMWYWYNGISREDKKRYFAHCKTYEDVKKRHGYTRVNNDQRQLASV